LENKLRHLEKSLRWRDLSTGMWIMRPPPRKGTTEESPHMWKNIAVATSLAVLGALAACGTPNKCNCGPGLLCEPETGQCVAKNTQAQCSPGCTGTTPICDNTSNPQSPRCVQC